MNGLKSLAAFGGLFVVLAVSVSTQQSPPSAESGPGVRAAQPVVPVAANTLAANPDRYIGSMVTLTAAVDQRLAETAFTVDQAPTNNAGKDVLVLTALLTAPVQPNTYVTVIGEVVQFNPATVAARMKEAMPSIPAHIAAKYQGRPAIIATSVINGAMTDLAKKLPPPMSPEEQVLSKAMKQVGPGFTALRQAASGGDAAEAATQAAALKAGFTEAAVFWKGTPRPDAMQWNADALRASGQIATAAGKGDLDAVKAAVTKLQQICSTCHTAYRERLDDGSYRFKSAR